MPLSASAKTQTGCLLLFCAPFCIAGVVALGLALRMADSPSVKVLDVFDLGTFGLAVFFLLWSGSLWLMINLKVLLFFVIVFGLFDVLIFIIVSTLWLGTSTVVIESGSLRIHSGILGLGRMREIPFSRIAGIKLPVGMQTGGRSRTPYYDIRLPLSDGKELTLASAIKNKLEAEWLVSKMSAAISLKPQPQSLPEEKVWGAG